MNDSETGRELPKYICHKKVWALQIAKIEYDSDAALLEGRETDGSATITPSDPGYEPFKVGPTFVRNRLPVTGPIVGGYYVVYKDGYESFSPQDAFEEGYSRL